MYVGSIVAPATEATTSQGRASELDDSIFSMVVVVVSVMRRRLLVEH
jgi:hypothetical protein